MTILSTLRLKLLGTSGITAAPKLFSPALSRGALSSRLVAKRNFSEGCGCTKNQTPKESFEALKAHPEKAHQLTGTGLFLVPDPEKGILEYKVVLVKDLTYREAVKRSENCQSLKWVPNTLVSFAQLEKGRDDCKNFYCGPNRDWCPIGCICGAGNYCI